jgi:hypothetical protein
MTTPITAVDTEVRIEHGVLIKLTLNGTPYYISNCYKTISYAGNDYTALAGFLTISEIQSNISSTNDDIQIGLSAIPSAYITAILGQPIKGGQIEIYRAFFDYTTQEVLTGEIYKRFTGVITNFSVQEDFDNTGNPTATHTIMVTASSILGVLENKISGRRTNADDLAIVYTEITNSGTDPSFDRVASLHNASFDFGRPYTAPSNQPGTGGGTGGGRDSQTEQP